MISACSTLYLKNLNYRTCWKFLMRIKYQSMFHVVMHRKNILRNLFWMPRLLGTHQKCCILEVFLVLERRCVSTKWFKKLNRDLSSKMRSINSFMWMGWGWRNLRTYSSIFWDSWLEGRLKQILRKLVTFWTIILRKGSVSRSKLIHKS